MLSLSSLKREDGRPNPWAAPESLSHFLRTLITRLGAQPPLSCGPVSGLSPQEHCSGVQGVAQASAGV